ncbi:DUF7657 domain-containing protein [Micromonospora sp. NPDC004704]
MKDNNGFRGRTLRLGGKFVRSIWFFPALLTAALLLLTALQISGSSIGVYHSVLYGAQAEDTHTLFNNPQPIRSDEFIVNTQLTIAQDAAGYPRINPNIGQGEDVSLIVDVPYKEWSTVFKPHNLVFLVLPFDNAFAFKWWSMAYLLVLSCYFFVLALMPKRRWFATGLSLALLFAPFVQWWYQYITLGPLYYALFAATVFILLVRSKRLLPSIAWGVLLAYLLTCFALVLYPPFQIPCALVVAAFAVGYLIEQGRLLPRRLLLRQLGIIAGSLGVGGALIGAFVATRIGVIETVQNTAYPGQRLIESGGFDVAHTFSGSTSFGLQFAEKAPLYQALSNQSENSNFLLVFPYLVVPSVFLLYRLFRTRRATDWPLLFTGIALLGLLSWMFVPHLGLVGKLLFLERVPHPRLLIGIGLLSFIGVVLFARRLDEEFARRREENRSALPGHRIVLGYTAVVLLVQVLLGLHVMDAYPGFMSERGLLISIIPITLVTYLVLRGRFAWGAAVLLVFSVGMTALIHPLYRGTDVLTSTPLSQAIRTIHAEDPGAVWATDVGSIQNFAYMNGARSMTGVYAYPQLDLWKTADETGQQEHVYNRYAHVWFNFDRDPAVTSPTTLNLPTPDHFEVNTEPCGAFLQQHQVRYIVTGTPLDGSCLELRETVPYPTATFLIYRIR